jgi:hypothetical protein
MSTLTRSPKAKSGRDEIPLNFKNTLTWGKLGKQGNIVKKMWKTHGPWLPLENCPLSMVGFPYRSLHRMVIHHLVEISERLMLPSRRCALPAMAKSLPWAKLRKHSEAEQHHDS